MTTFNYLVAGAAVVAAPAFGIAMGWALKPVRRKRAAPEFVEVPVLTADDLRAAAKDRPVTYSHAPVLIDGQCLERTRPSWWKPAGAEIVAAPHQLTAEAAPYSRKPGASRAINQLYAAGLSAFGHSDVLTKQEQDVIAMRGGWEMSTRELAQRMNLAPSTIVAIERRAVDKVLAAKVGKEAARV